MMTSIALPDICRAAVYAPNGQIIVCGMGGSVRGSGRPATRDFDGKVAIVSYLQGVLQIVHIAGDAKDAITSICFSPSGDQLYIGSLDSNIYVYDPFDNFKLINTLKSHGEGVQSLNVDKEGKHMLSCGVDGEILTWDLVMGSPCVLSPQDWKELKWAIRTTPRGKNSTGVFAPYTSASVVSSLAESSDNKLLATGDAFGHVNLYSNPAMHLSAPCKKFFGHSAGGVSAVSFSVEDKYVLSCGTDDRTLIQWTLNKSSVPSCTFFEAAGPEPPLEEASTVVPLGNFNDSFLVGAPDKFDVSTYGANAAQPAEPVKAPALALQASIGTLGTSPKALYSSMGNSITITGKKVATNNADRLTQQFGWATPNGGDDCIGAFAVSSCARFAAVGSKTSPASLSLLNASTGAYVCSLAENVLGGVLDVAFSHCSKYVACISGDARHTLRIFSSISGNWRDSLLHYSGETSASAVDSVSFLSGGAFDLVTGGGDDVLKWWKISGRNVTSQSAAIQWGTIPAGGVENFRTTTIIGLPGTGCLAVGDNYGSITRFSSPTESCSVGIPAVVDELKGTVIVPGPMTAMATGALGTLFTGSADGISIYNYTAQKQLDDTSAATVVSMETICASLTNKEYLDAITAGVYPSCISAGNLGMRLLVSLSSNAVVEVALDSGKSYVVDEGEINVPVKCSIAHPTEPNTLVTALATGTIKVWDLKKEAREVVGMMNTDKKTPSALAFCNDTTMAVGIDRSDTGGSSGAIILIEIGAAAAIEGDSGGRILQGANSRSMKIVKKLHNIGKGVISCIQASPDGAYLAAASADGCVYFFDIKNDYSPVGLLVAFPANEPAANMDWSVCSGFLRCFGVTHAGDNLIKASYFSVIKGAKEGDEPGAKLQDEIDLDKLKPVEWNSISSPACAEAKGVHPASVPGVGAAVGEIADPVVSAALPTVTSTSSGKGPLGQALVAAGYSDGSMKVFAVPSNAEVFSAVNDHNPGSVNVSFLAGGNLASLSTTDASIMTYSLN